MNAAKIIMTVEDAASVSALSSTDVIAIASALIALISLGLAAWIGRSQSKHFRLSSKPLLDLTFATSGTLVELENHGFGPAAIETFTAKTIGGEILDLLQTDQLPKLTAELVDGIQNVGPNFCGSLSHEGILGAGRTFPIVRIHRAFAPNEVEQVRQNFRGVEFTVTYRCIYGIRQTTRQEGFR
ncbi:hypothetical protein D3C81_644650 [compost metagenome]